MARAQGKGIASVRRKLRRHSREGSCVELGLDFEVYPSLKGVRSRFNSYQVAAPLLHPDAEEASKSDGLARESRVTLLGICLEYEDSGLKPRWLRRRRCWAAGAAGLEALSPSF